MKKLGKISFFKNQNHLDILIVFIVSIIFTGILLNKILFTPGTIMFSDFNLPIYTDRFVDYHLNIWDSMSSASRMEIIGSIFARIPFIILAYLGIDVGIIEKLMYSSMYIIGIFSAYFFLRKVINLEHLPSLVLSLAYVIFGHFFVAMFMYSALFGGMIFPAIFTFFYLGINNKNMVYIIISGILAVTIIQTPFTLFVTNLLILTYAIFSFIFSKDLAILTRYISFMIIQISVGSFYFLLFLVSPPTPESMTGNIVTYEQIIGFSTQRGYFDPLLGFPATYVKMYLQSFYSDILLKQIQFLVSGIFLAILPFSFLVLSMIREKTKISKLTIFFSIILFTFWQISLGDIGLFGSFYTKIIAENSIFAFMRSPGRYYVFIPFVTIGLLGMLFKSIKRPRLQILFTIIFLMSIIFVSFPSIIMWNNNLKPVQIPGEFEDVQSIVEKDLQQNNGYFRTIWYPIYGGDTTWGAQNTLGFEEKSSKIPTYSYQRNDYRSMSIFNGYIWDLLGHNQTMLVSKYLNQYRTKYIIFHDDIIYSNKNRKREAKNILNNLLSSPDFELRYQKRFIYLFENKNYERREYFDINSDLPIMLESFNLQNVIKSADMYRDYFFLDDGYTGVLNIFNFSRNIIVNDFSNYLNDLVYYDLSKYDYYFYPGKETFHHNEKKYWSIRNGWLIKPAFGDFIKGNIDKNFSGYLFDFGKRITTAVGKNVTIDYEINIKKSGNYVFITRLLENKKGGSIEIKLDEKSYIIDTNKDISRFVWIDVDKIYLESGKHHLMLKNIKGVNAVNIFGLVPENDYNNTKEKIIDSLKNKKIIYIIDNGSNVTDINVAKKGGYTLAMRGVGKFDFNINENHFILESDSENFTYSPVINMNEGINKIQISSSNNSLKSIWLYPNIYDNKTIDEILYIREKRTKLVDFTNIGSNTWNIKVNATGSFMLSLAEAYNSAWEATVYKDGQKVDVVEASPLHSFINGFWINDIGNLEIIVRYKNEYWYNIGLLISIIAFICCIGYISYDWKRNKDKKK